MKILFIIDSLCKGGKERRLLELMKGLKIRNVIFELILLTDLIEFKEVYDLGMKIHILKRKIKKDPLIYLQVNKICKNFKPDIINSWGLMPSVYAMPVAKWRRIKFINSMIVNAPKKLTFKTKFFSSIVFPFSDVIAANSYAGLRSYGIEKDRGIVIYNGYDFNRIENLEDINVVRTRWNIKTEFIIGMVAGFRPHKDYKTLIVAAKSILKTRDDISFILVGDGPDLERSKKMAERYDKIIFTGRQSAVESIINICDIGILSTYTEGISNSIIEFMAIGKPVIATDGGGTNEIIIHKETGYLIPKESPEILRETVLKLVNDSELTQKLGQNGKERIVREFSMNSMIGSYHSLYKSTVKKD